MKLTSRAYWIVVFLGIFANIAIFCFMSKGLEEYVYYKTLEKYNVNDPTVIDFSEQQ